MFCILAFIKNVFEDENELRNIFYILYDTKRGNLRFLGKLYS